MIAPAERLLTALLHRVRLATFCVAWADAAAVLALALASTLVTLRFFGAGPEPAPSWLCLLAIPLVWAAWQTARVGLSRLQAATWLDRKLGLEGLLVMAAETPSEAWQSELQSRLADGTPVLPRYDLRQIFQRILPAAVVLTVALLLPPAALTPRVANPLIGHTLLELHDKIAELEEKKLVNQEQQNELEKRLEQLEKANRNGEPLDWADVDSLEQGVERALAQSHDAASKLERALERAAKGNPAALDEKLKQELEKALQAAKEQGLLETIDPDLAKRAEKALEGDRSLQLTQEELSKLALDLKDHLEAKRKLLEQMDPQALRELLEAELFEPVDPQLQEELDPAGAESMEGHEHTEECGDGH